MFYDFYFKSRNPNILRSKNWLYKNNLNKKMSNPVLMKLY